MKDTGKNGGLYSAECMLDYEGHLRFFIFPSYELAKKQVTKWVRGHKGDSYAVRKLVPGNFLLQVNLLDADDAWQDALARYEDGEVWNEGRGDLTASLAYNKTMALKQIWTAPPNVNIAPEEFEGELSFYTDGVNVFCVNRDEHLAFVWSANDMGWVETDCDAVRDRINAEITNGRGW